MEDQGKRLLLAVVLALGILLLWNVIFPSEKPAPKPTTDESGQTLVRESPVGTPMEGLPAPAPTTAELTDDVPPLELENVVVQFSRRGGKLVSWQLRDPKYARDPHQGQLVPSAEVGAFTVNFYKSPIVIPKDAIWDRVTEVVDNEGSRTLGENEIGFRYESPEMLVTKWFRVHPADYLLDINVQVELKALPDGGERKASQQLAVSMIGQQETKASREQGRVHRAACHIGGSVSQVDPTKLHKEGPVERGGNVRWVGFNHPYIFAAMAPDPSQVQGSVACNAYPILSVDGGMQVDLIYPEANLSSKAPPLRRHLVAYLGPKHLSALEHAGDVAGFGTGFDDSVDLGWFSFIARPLLSLLAWFYSFTGNWGIAIILLTILVKLATLYWTTKSMRSMRRMGALKPQIEELQKKYADDRTKLQQEMMALYKVNGVNPVAGCLPLLLQMPIWLALYRMLSAAGELYLAPFIPGWISDLTATDPFYILPIALMVAMFVQSKLSPTTMDSMQQKILVYGMPLMFGVMGFFFPSGLSLYILTNTLLSLLHTLYMKKFDGAGKTPVVPPRAAAPAINVREAAKKRDAAGSKKVIDVAPASEDAGRDDVAEDDGDDEADDAAPSTSSAPGGARPGPGPGARKNQVRRKKKRKN